MFVVAQLNRRTSGEGQRTAGICVLGFALSLAPKYVTSPWPCLTQVSRRAPSLCSCLGLVCLVSQQCWADGKFSMKEENPVGQKCVGGDSQSSNLCIILLLLLLRMIFHVLFIKSFEHLLGPKDCLSSAWISCLGIQQPYCCAKR